MTEAKTVRVADITWLGEDHLHAEGSGPSRNVWNGITFKIGEPVMVSVPSMIDKAKSNPFYKVENEREEAVEGDDPAPEPDETDNHGGDIEKMNIGQLRWKAQQMGIAHDGVGKKELRAAIAKALEPAAS